MELRLDVRRPKWYERKWKPKKPILYIIEMIGGKWVNTYWWGGNWKNKGLIKFKNSGTVTINQFFGSRSQADHILLVIGRSGTTLTIQEHLGDRGKLKGLNPRDTEWTYFGEITTFGIFVPGKVSKFNLTEKIKESY